MKRLFALLALCGLTLAPVFAMTPEEQAIYDEMVRQSGLDPAEVAKATRQAEAARAGMESNGGLYHYDIVGVYQRETDISGDSNWPAYADVSDRVEISLSWNLSALELAGDPAVTNYASVTGTPRNFERSCEPPTVEGTYEQADVQGVAQGMGGTVTLTVQTRHPALKVVQMCVGSRKPIPASEETTMIELVVPSPVALTMDVPPSNDMEITPDKHSIIWRKDGWTWTFTPR